MAEHPDAYRSCSPELPLHEPPPEFSPRGEGPGRSVPLYDWSDTSPCDLNGFNEMLNALEHLGPSIREEVSALITFVDLNSANILKSISVGSAVHYPPLVQYTSL